MLKRKAEVEQAPSAPPNRRSSRNKPNVDEVKGEVKSEEQAPPPFKSSKVKPPKSKAKVKAKEETDGQDVKAKVCPTAHFSSPYVVSKIGRAHV